MKPKINNVNNFNRLDSIIRHLGLQSGVVTFMFVSGKLEMDVGAYLNGMSPSSVMNQINGAAIANKTNVKKGNVTIMADLGNYHG